MPLEASRLVVRGTSSRPVPRWPHELSPLDLVSSRCGLLTNLSQPPRGAEEPRPPFLVTGQLARHLFRSGRDEQTVVAGIGETIAQATASALGEAVERSAALLVDETALRLASYQELVVAGEAIVDPRRFVLYDDAYYARPDARWPRFDPSRPIHWSRATALGSGASCYVPASLVYLDGGRFATEAWCDMTSNGLAAGPTPARARVSGLYELIERDAFLTNWLWRLPAPEIDLRSTSGIVAHAVRHYRRFGVAVRAYRLLTDLPASVVLSLALDATGHGPAAFIGLGCHADPVRALEKAVLETCQGRPSESHRRRRDDTPVPGCPEEVRDLFDHSRYFAEPDRLPELAFWLDREPGRTVTLGPLAAPHPDPEAELARLVAGLAAVGVETFAVDVTTPDVAPYGYHVVRTLATALQPMHFGFGEERLGSDRLFDLPRRLGLRPDHASRGELNRCPHPLA